MYAKEQKEILGAPGKAIFLRTQSRAATNTLLGRAGVGGASTYRGDVPLADLQDSNDPFFSRKENFTFGSVLYSAAVNGGLLSGDELDKAVRPEEMVGPLKKA